MKRTNLVLDEQLLKTVIQMFGAKTYSEAVNRSLKESIRLMQMRGILDFIGSGAWEGDLSKMRKDHKPAKH
ncbi:MAG: hypothetical protein A2583_15670 [Bdellovibrionales bacterium RIFOXYD1_FULL_53_11]|nr:MAG: hypothetical protein A2583_15670 [Bdellovibrionales bacterium RIFOXYD1_FULL_53_11]